MESFNSQDEFITLTISADSPFQPSAYKRADAVFNPRKF